MNKLKKLYLVFVLIFGYVNAMNGVSNELTNQNGNTFNQGLQPVEASLEETLPSGMFNVFCIGVVKHTNSKKHPSNINWIDMSNISLETISCLSSLTCHVENSVRMGELTSLPIFDLYFKVQKNTFHCEISMKTLLQMYEWKNAEGATAIVKNFFDSIKNGTLCVKVEEGEIKGLW